jgi:hypothetical protein
MSCCGRPRLQSFVLPTYPASTTSAGSVTFQYIGKTRLTVIGPVSRRRYDFDRAGSRIAVDPRDSASFAAVPTLKRV